MSFDYPVATLERISLDTSKTADKLLNLMIVFEFIKRVLNIWHSVPVEMVTFKRLSAAMTNTIFILSHPLIGEGEPMKILLRIYGEGVEHILNRTEELEWFKKLSEAGAGPKLLATFDNGRFEEYIESVTLNPSMMRSSDISVKIAEQMALFHGLPIERDGSAVIMKRIKNWRKEASEAFESLLLRNPENVEILMKIASFSILQEAEYLTGKFRKYFDELKALSNPIVPSHNDLQHGNILLTDRNRIVFIDYEYGGMNYAAYDIANHFCEWASDFTEANPSPHLMNFDDNYPSKLERERFIRTYLGLYDECGEGTDVIVAYWVEAVEKFKEISHLSWALWGVIQAANSKNDFDYLGYSLMRLEAMRL